MLRILALLTLLLTAPLAAQTLPPRGQTAIVPQLLVDGHALPGGEVDLAIAMHTTPGWHGYWSNPGDAGKPMAVEWTLPPGWSVGPMRYPVPSKLLVADIPNFVYEKDYAVLMRLRAPAGATGIQHLTAKLNWLACTAEICVPEKGMVSLDVATGGAATVDPRFDDFRRTLPRPLASVAHFALTAKTLRLAIPIPSSASIGEPYFFPSTDGPIDYSAPQIFKRQGDLLIAELQRRRGDPATLDGVLSFGDGRGLQLHAVPGTVPSGEGPGASAILFAILGALAGGILLNLMPCVFPILALKALHLAKSGGGKRDSLAYAAGAVAGTSALGAALLAIRASGTAAGWAFQLQDPRTILILVLLATAITLNLLRVFELPVIGSEQNPTGSFGTGALAAFVATPCAGPFLGAALGTALLLPAAGSMAVFAALGLGLALPFIAIAFIPALRSLLPKPGAWMATLQRILAVPMALTAAACLWLLWRQGGVSGLLAGLISVALLVAALILAGRNQRKGKPAIALPVILFAIAAAAPIVGLGRGELAVVGRPPAGTEQWSETAVASALAAGHPVFVDFTADWCLTCKVNEAGAINRDSVRTAFRKAGVVEFVGDWTNGDPAITRFLESRARAGVPLYLWYEPGEAEPEELPQVLTQAMLSERAGRPR